MARRNLDNDFFKKPFIRSLSSRMKLFYLYVICDTDHAGIWIPDFEIANIYLRGKSTPAEGLHNPRETSEQNEITPEEVQECFGSRVVVLPNGDWFFPEIIKKQYPKGLGGNNNAVVSAKNILLKHNLLDENLQVKDFSKDNFDEKNEGLSRGSGTHNKIEIEIETEIEEEKKITAKSVSVDEEGKVQEVRMQREGFDSHVMEMAKAFNLNEFMHHKNLVRIQLWLDTMDTEYVRKQLRSYLEYKLISGENKCGWVTWIEGKWNEEDYSQKLEKAQKAQGSKRKDDRPQLTGPRNYGGN